MLKKFFQSEIERTFHFHYGAHSGSTELIQGLGAEFGLGCLVFI
jgi:hypothetical protein